jgi:type II secretory pathway component GspD/PulD (secretin)
LRIRNSVLVAVLSLGLPAATLTSPAYGQAAQPTAQELYESGMEQYKAGQLKEAQATLRKVDPLQLPRELQPTFYNALFDIDQKLNAGAPDKPEPEVVDPTETDAQPVQPETTTPNDATLLKQADALAGKNPAEALAVYQQVAASETASDQQKATAQARIAGIERQLNGDITGARKLIALAEQDIVAGNLDAAQAKLQSVKNSGIELGFFDAESVNKKLALISEVKAARAAAAEAETETPEPQGPVVEGPEPTDDEAAKLKAQLAEAEAKLAATQRQLAEAQEAQEGENVGRGAPVSDVMRKAMLQNAEEQAAEADRAMDNGRLSAAVKLYEQATLLDPDNQAYKDKLAKAQAMLNEQVRPLDLIDQNTADIKVARDRAVAEYESAMKQAADDLENQDFQAANDAVIQARTVLTQNRGVFDTARYNELTARAGRLQNEIQETRRRAEAIELREAEDDARRKEIAAAAEAERRKVQEVQARLMAARALQKEQKYDLALDELDAALFLDPGNPVIQGFRDMIQDSSFAVESKRLRREREIQAANLSIMNIEASTPYTDILTYPGEWPELTATRLRGLDSNAGESEANRAAQASLRQIVSLNNDNFSLDQVIDYIRESTGANIAVNWPALELVGIDQDSLVSISLTNVPASQLLRLVLDQVSADAFDDDKAGFTVSEGVVKISTLRDLKTETETQVYDIRDLLVQVPNFSNAPGFDLNEALSNTSSGGSNSGGGGGGGGSGSGGLFGDDNNNDQQEDLPSREELVEDIVELIQTTVGDPDEWLDEESTLTELNGNMIIKTTADNHRQILGLLGRLRETRAVQISVEARFLTVDNSFIEEFLLDVDVTFDGDNADNFINGELDDDGNPVPGFDGLPDNGASNLPVTVTNNSSDLAQRLTSPFDRLTLGSPAMSVGYSFINDLQVDLMLNATQANEKQITLNAPRVTFFNGQRAYVMIATQTAFVSDLEPVPDAIGFDPTISVVTTGAVLDVEGTISSDRRYVTLTMRPSLANLISLQDFQIGAGAVLEDPDPDADPLISLPGTIQVPEIQITQVRNTVSVPDRGTLLIGGQRLVGEASVEVGVPVLSKIPVLNRLFTNTSQAQDERTLLILVKPTIIIQTEQEEFLFPGLNADPEGYNVGAFGG